MTHPPGAPAAGSAPVAPHPTVPYGEGLPGGAPPAATTQTPVGNGQIPAAPAQPAAAPVAPAAPAPPQLPSGVQLNDTIPNQPGVPPELIGRTWGQAFQIYSALAQDWMQRNQPSRTAPAAPAAAQPAAAPAQPAGGQPAGAGDFWQDPAGFVSQAVKAAVAEAVKPITQNTQEDAIIRARDAARQQVPDFVELWPDLVNTLQGTDPTALADVNVWIGAADLIRGRRLRAGLPATAPAGAASASPPNGAYAAAGGLPSVPAPQGPSLPQYAFFSEAPTTPTQHQPASGLTAREIEVASKFGMTPDQYQAWKGGVSRGR